MMTIQFAVYTLSNVTHFANRHIPHSTYEVEDHNAPNLPGVADGGEKKFYASTVSNGEMTLNKLTKTMEKISTVSGADIRAVVYAMVDVMKDALADGQIVRLGDLGSLRISLSSQPEDTA